LKKVAILQSNYIPWKGYFDLIADVDEFILFDDMQFTRRDWRNRNQIKTPQGVQWLSVPVLVKGKFDQKISDTLIDGSDWAAAHWKSLEHNYRRAEYFREIADWLEPLYKKEVWTHLSSLNFQFLKAICTYLKIETRMTYSSSFPILESSKTDRLVEICRQSNASCYVSGPAAKGYLDERQFLKAGVDVSWFDYSGYPEYSQLWNGAFTHHVSVLDLLFNCGPTAPNYMKHVLK
jgi:WbqC-like protein family